MLVVLIILSLGLLAVIIYFALSGKSSKTLKLAAIIALGAIVLSILVAGIIIFIGPSEDTTSVPMPIFSDTPAQAEGGRSLGDFLILAVFIVILSLVMYRAAKSQKKQAEAAKTVKTPIKETKAFDEPLEDLDHHDAFGDEFADDAAPIGDDSPGGEESKKDDEEDFDLDV